MMEPPLSTAIEESMRHDTVGYEPPPAFASQQRPPFRQQAWRGAEEEAWRQAYGTAAAEAAQWGRLTRLKERCIETTVSHPADDSAKTPQEPTTWKSKGLLNLFPPVNRVREVAKEAARKGAATKLPERIVSNFPEEASPDTESSPQKLRHSFRYWLLVSSAAAGRCDDSEDCDGVCKIERLIRALKEYDAREKELSRPHFAAGNVDLPAPPQLAYLVSPSPLQREFPVRPMIELSTSVAFAAWERRARLDRPSSIPKIRDICRCTWCQSASPQQTHAYIQQRQAQRSPSDTQKVSKLQHALEQGLPRATKSLPKMSKNRRMVPKLVHLRESARQHRVSVLTLPPELHMTASHIGDDESSGYTEVTVSTADPDEEDEHHEHPVITVVPLQRRPSDITFEEASFMPLEKPPVEVSMSSCQRSRTAGNNPSSESTPPTLPSSNPTSTSKPSSRGSTGGPWKPPSNQVLVPSLQRPTTGRPECRRNALPPPRAALRPTRPPKAEFVVELQPNEDVSTLTLPVYFEDALEQAILEQMMATKKVVTARKAAPCRLTKFFTGHLKGPNN